MMTLAEKIDDREAHRAAVEAGYASLPDYIREHGPLLEPRPNLAGPFPNLRCREVVKAIVDRVVEVTTHCKFSDKEASAFALGLVQGARIVAKHDEETTLEVFVVELLAKLNRGGVDAVKELVEIVTGHELTVAEAA